MSELNSLPYRPTTAKCCDACVFGRGQHAIWCSVVLDRLSIRHADDFLRTHPVFSDAYNPRNYSQTMTLTIPQERKSPVTLLPVAVDDQEECLCCKGTKWEHSDSQWAYCKSVIRHRDRKANKQKLEEFWRGKTY